MSPKNFNMGETNSLMGGDSGFLDWVSNRRGQGSDRGGGPPIPPPFGQPCNMGSWYFLDRALSTLLPPPPISQTLHLIGLNNQKRKKSKGRHHN